MSKLFNDITQAANPALSQRIFAPPDISTDEYVTIGQIRGGFAGGSTLSGGSGSGEALTLQSTEDATKGLIKLGANSAYDESNDKLGIGTTSPPHDLHIAKAGQVAIGLRDTNADADAERWAMTVINSGGSSQFTIYAVNDDGTTGSNFLRLQRSGNSITNFRVGSATMWALDVSVVGGRVVFVLPESDPGSGALQNGQAVFYRSGSNFAVRSKTVAGVNETAGLGTFV